MVLKKQCTKCLEEKKLSDFPMRKDSKDGFRNECKLCSKNYNIKYRKDNDIELSSKKKKYYLKNKDELLLKCKEYRNKPEVKKRKKESDKKYQLENKDKIRDYQKEWAREWRKNNIEKSHEQGRKYNKKRRSTIQGTINHRMEVNIRKSLKQNKSGRKWELLVGYTVDDLKKHFDKLFIGNMNWDKFLSGDIHIDHRTPKSWFKYNSYKDEEFKMCWALKNLKPMWAKDNISKSNRYED